MTYYFSGNSDISALPDPGNQQVQICDGYNIERVLYPTGAETRYKYKCIYPVNRTTKVRRGVYAVEKVYDIVDDEEVNIKEYEVEGTSSELTVTCNEDDIERTTVTEYNEEALAEVINITHQSDDDAPYKKIEYSYDSNGNPTLMEVNENGTKNSISYSYKSGYPNMLTKESDGLKSIEYNYHVVPVRIKDDATAEDAYKDMYTDMVSKVTYSKMSGDDYVEDYHIATTLTSDNKSIEFEKAIQSDIIKSQKKYEYDTAGEIVAIKQWTNDTNADGVLDENDDIITLSNTYTVTAQKTKDVTNAVADVLNADGDNEGPVNVTYKYNIYGTPLSQKDPYNIETTIEYDDINRPIKYNLPNGGTRLIEYHTEDNYTLVTDEAGIVTKNVYDELGRIKEKYASNGSAFNKIEEYTYDTVGRAASKTSYRSSSEGTREKYAYDILDRVVEKKVYELPNTLLYTEEYSYTNNASQSVITKIIEASDATTATQRSYYNVYGQLTAESSSYGAKSLTTRYEYDYLGRVVKATDANNNITTYEYSYDGQVSKQTNAAGDSVSTVYDLAGQAVSVTDAKGNVTNTEYDKLGRVIKVSTPFNDTTNGESKTYYDKNSNVVKTALKRNSSEYQTQEFMYDVMGNMVASITENGDNDIVTQYTYDTASRITKMITGLTAYSENPTGGATTQYSYNIRGFLDQITDPMGYTESYDSYDRLGNVLSKTDKNGNTLKYIYGPFGIEKEYSADSVESRQYEYNNIGLLSRTVSVNKDGTTETQNNSYDAFGRLSSTTSGNGDVQNYTYDSNSNITNYELTSGGEVKNSVDYVYNVLNQLTQLTNNDIITSYSYDKNGALTEKSLSNGFKTEYIYNKAGLLISQNDFLNNISYNTYTCNYLLNGLKQSEIYNTNTSRSYSYDTAGQLYLEHEINTETYKSAVLNRYEYDAYGNRVRRFSNGDGYNRQETLYSYDANNRLTSTTISDNNGYSGAERYYYDKNGNQLAKQKTEYDNSGSNNATLSGRSADTGLSIYRYDAFNRLTNYNSGSAEASYTYYADNLRASKTVNRDKTNFTWNGQNLASETTAGVTNTYTYDITGIHSSVINGTYSSYIKDTHGSVIGKLNSAGEVVSSGIIYDAFGKLYSETTPDPFGYCGEYYDWETGLIYLRNRYYSSDMGRFITEDPIKDGLNWYAYCAGDPVNAWDPSGLGLLKDFFDWLFPTAYAPGYDDTYNQNEDILVVQAEVINKKEQITTIGDVPIYKVESSLGVYLEFTTGLKVDADGSPHAYHPSDIGLDYLENAGHPGDWWGIVTDKDQPVIQDENDPAPGYYVSMTSLNNPGYDDDDPRKYINSEEVAYIAIPRELKQYGAKLGSRVLVFNTSQDISVGVEAIVADIGPDGKIGEGSIYLAEKLDVPSSPKNGGTNSNITYRIYIE